jgi:hypothetical protein
MIEVFIKGEKLCRWRDLTSADVLEVEQIMSAVADAEDTTPDEMAYNLISRLMQSTALPSSMRQGAMNTLLWLLLQRSWSTPERPAQIRDYIEEHDFYCNITQPSDDPEFELSIMRLPPTLRCNIKW